MPVKCCVIHGQAICSLDELYDELAVCLPLPEHFGRNLDALWDVLSTDIEGPVEFVWEDSAFSRETMGKDFLRVEALLRELEAEREDFRVSFR